MSDSSDSELEAAFVRPIAVPPHQRRRNGRSIDLTNQPGPNRIVPRPPENADVERADLSARTSQSTNRRRKKRRPPRILGSRNHIHGRYYPPSKWMAEQFPRKTYFPQIFDRVVYLRQAHEIYFTVVKRKYPQYYKPILAPPWELFDLAAEEPCRVIDVEFVLCPARMCRLQLQVKRTNDKFWICYHPVVEAADFLVLSDIFNYGPNAEWQVGDRFRCIVSSNNWRIGTITGITPLESRFPESHFNRYEVRWDDGADGRLSYWDLGPFYLEGLVNAKGEEIPLDDGPGIGVHIRPDMPLGHHRVYNNIFAKFNEVYQRSFCEPFQNAIHEREDPMYLKVIAYPVDFFLILTRFTNGFYRRIASLLTDIDYMKRNALLYYPRNHDCVRIARFCHVLLTRIISNYERNVPMSMMFNDSVIEQAEDEIESEEDKRERSKNRYRPKNENRQPILRMIPSNQEIPVNEAPQDLRIAPHRVHSDRRPDENRPAILQQIPNNEVPQIGGRAPLHFRQVPAVYDSRSRSFLSFMPPLIDNWRQKLASSRHCKNAESDTGDGYSELLSDLHASARQNFNAFHNPFMAHRNQPSRRDRWRHIRNPPLVFLITGAPLRQRLVRILRQPLIFGKVKNKSSTSKHQHRNRSLPLDLSTHGNRPLTNEIQERVRNSPVFQIDDHQPSTSQSQGFVRCSQSHFEIYQNQPSTSLRQMRVRCSQSLFEIYQKQPSTSQSNVNSPLSVLERDLNQLSTSLLQERVSSPTSVFDQIQSPINEPQKCPDSPPLDLTAERKQPPSSQDKKRIGNPSSLGLKFNQPSTSQRCQKPLDSPSLSPNIDYDQTSTDPPLALITQRRRKQKRAPSNHHQQPIEPPSSLSDTTESSASESIESKRYRERAGINKILIKANVWRLGCMDMVQNLLSEINDLMFSEPAMYSYRRGAFEWHNLETVLYELEGALFRDPYAVLTAVHENFIEGRRLNVTGDEEVSAIINRLSLNFNRGMEPIINRWSALNNAEKE